MAATEIDPHAGPLPVELSQKDMRNARLFANRREMVRGLDLPSGGMVCEVGVAFGDFSEFLLAELKPQKFVAIDLWGFHNYPIIWGKPTKDIMGEKTHFEYFADRFNSKSDILMMLSGLSFDIIDNFPDNAFDLIYIDAGHDYSSVKKDADAARRKVKPGGVLIFNDYVMFDHLAKAPYGVVPVVNELASQDDWTVAGFALEQQMFCDIALKRLF